MKIRAEVLTRGSKTKTDLLFSLLLSSSSLSLSLLLGLSMTTKRMSIDKLEKKGRFGMKRTSSSAFFLAASASAFFLASSLAAGAGLAAAGAGLAAAGAAAGVAAAGAAPEAGAAPFWPHIFMRSLTDINPDMIFLYLRE